MGSDLGEAIENDRFANELKNARANGDMDHFARVLSGRLRQMDKRAKAANIRADKAEKERDLAQAMLSMVRREIAARRSALAPEIKEGRRHGEG